MDLSAERTSDKQMVMPLRIRPLLVLTGEADSQERDFYDLVPLGGSLLVFGAVHPPGKRPDVTGRGSGPAARE